MGSKPKTPAPLDVQGVSQQANQQNMMNAGQQAAYNRINQQGPFGSVSYSQTGTDASGNPIFSQSTQLDPTQLKYLSELQQGASGAYKGGLAGLSGLAQSAESGPKLDPWGVGQSGVNRLTGEFGSPMQDSSQGALDQAYKFATARMERGLGEQEGALRNRLANQGLSAGSEAYERELRNLRESGEGMRNEAAANLQNQFFSQGMAERGQNYNEAAGLYNMGQQAGAQQFSQQMAPYQMLASQGGLINPVLNPGVSSFNPVNVANVDVAGLNQASKANEYQNYNAQMQQYNAMLGGIGGLAGKVLGGPIGGAIGSRLMGGLGSTTA
jgi:hypothetical protein